MNNMHDPSLPLILLKKLCVRLGRTIAPTSMTNETEVIKIADEIIEQANALKDWAEKKSK